jgi:hypothetical protein
MIRGGKVARLLLLTYDLFGIRQAYGVLKRKIIKHMNDHWEDDDVCI